MDVWLVGWWVGWFVGLNIWLIDFIYYEIMQETCTTEMLKLSHEKALLYDDDDDDKDDDADDDVEDDDEEEDKDEDEDDNGQFCRRYVFVSSTSLYTLW